MTDEYLPYINAQCDLVIPTDSPEYYHWWKKQGQSVNDTIIEIVCRGINKLVLIDAQNLLFQSDFTEGDYNGKQRISGIRNLLSKLRKIVNENASCRAIAIFEGGHNRRNEIYPEYKMQRKHDDLHNEILSQVKILEKVLSWFGIYSIRQNPYEADDLIASLALTFKHKILVNIYSSDSDLLQLIDKNVTILTNKKVVNIENFEEKTGFTNRQTFLLGKVIMGDVADGIRGINGIGEKTFQKMLKSVNGDIVEFMKLQVIQDNMQIVQRNKELIVLKKVDFDVKKIGIPLEINKERIVDLLKYLKYEKALRDIDEFLMPFVKNMEGK